MAAKIFALRSREMARYTYELAAKERARVVYMSFGALHAHGVIKGVRMLLGITKLGPIK